jgi:hypothetical protein
MAKRCTIQLEFEPRSLDNYADYFIVNYQDPIPFVDIYEKSGTFYERIDVQMQLDSHDLKLHSISYAIFPRMRWSDRKLEEFERMNKLTLLKKFIVVGECK